MQTVPGNSRITPGNKAQVVVVYAAILADIFVTAYTDTLRTTEVLAIILLLRCAENPLDQQPAMIHVWALWPILSYYCLFLSCPGHDCSLQIFLLLAIILAFFLLTTSISPHVQLGLYNKYIKQHRAVFVLSLLTLLLVGSTGAYRLVSVHGRAAPRR